MKLVAPISALFLVASLAIAQSKSEAVVPELQGTWRLVSIVGEGGGRGGYPSDKPSGLIIYDNTGHMSVQIRYSSNRGGKVGSAEERAAAFDNYVAYYGSFKVNAADRTIVHHIDGSLRPGDIGKDFFRYYEFEGT